MFYEYGPRCLLINLEKIITEFIKMTPFKSLHTIESYTVCRFLDDPQMFLYLVIVVHESLVGPEQFPQLLHIIWFSSIFCIFEPFPKVTV